MTAPHDSTSEILYPGRRRLIRRAMFAGAAAIFLAVFLVPRAIQFDTDWLWFSEIGFQSVFTARLVWRVALFVGCGGVTFAFLYGNARLATRGSTITPMVFVDRHGRRVEFQHSIPRLVGIGAALVALIVGAAAAGDWISFATAAHGSVVGTVDPVFGRDLGFYLFRLDAIEGIVDASVTLTWMTLGAVAALYAIRGMLATAGSGRFTLLAPSARHVGVLVALLFFEMAIRLWFVGTSELVFSTTGPLVGASYSDVHALLPGIRISAVVAVVVSGVVLFGALRARVGRPALIAVVTYVAVSVLTRGLIPFAVQRLVVAPNELASETDYLQRHISATRAAWGLDHVATRDLTGEAQLTAADIRANGATIDNVRLWERDLVQQSFKQLQEIRTYYDFVSITDDRYTIDGKYRQVHLSARELNTSLLATHSFINERFSYTHGMGVTMAPVNQVTGEGLPLLMIKDLPPVSTVSIALKRPQIYYGEMTNGYVFVGTRQPEFDYPAGDADQHTAYTGRGGVPVGSFFRRFLYAWQFGSKNVLLSNDFTADSRILYRRNIEQRATTALPFLTFDPEPYLVISDAGELKWIMDGYTRSSRYPYSQRVDGTTNYLRNSVKVVIDAYDGTVDAYIADTTDAIIRTYQSMFAGIFKPLSAMPEDLRRHMRYPSELFRAQATLHGTYHMEKPDAFYHREDQWQFPDEGDTRDESVSPFMRHIILRLPGEKQPEFIYMMPFTPRGKDNLAAWIVGRMDGDHYGELAVYRFPKQSLVYGPKQVSNRINQETDISSQITLWDQRGSEVIRGELLVIPIEEALLYVQPLFLRAKGGTIPELKRVIIAVGNRVVMAETLEEGLAQVFGGAAAVRPTVAGAAAPAPTAPPAPSGNQTDLLRQAQEHYDRAMAAQRAGNWAEYGREIEALGAILKKLSR